MTLRYRNDTGAQLFHHIHRFANPCQRIERVASETNLTWYSQRNPAKPSDSLTWLTNLTNCLVSRFADEDCLMLKRAQKEQANKKDGKQNANKAQDVQEASNVALAEEFDSDNY